MASRLLGVTAAFGFATGLLPAATIVSGFDLANGSYVSGNTVVGVQDTSLGGTWASLFGSPSTAATSSSSHPSDGALDIRITNSGSAVGAQAQVTNIGSLLTSPFTISISFDLISESGTGAGPQLDFGNSITGNGSQWLQMTYGSTGHLSLVTSNGASTGTVYTAADLGTYASYSPLSSYVTLSVTINPTTHLYTNVTLSGTNQTLDLTSTVQAVNGGMIPWNGTNPGNYLSLIAGSNTTTTVDFDKFSVSPVPEPGILGLVGGGLALLARRRKGKR